MILKEVSSMNGSSLRKESMMSFYMIVLYLFLEYGRPQNLIPFLRFLHLPAITIALIAIILLFSGKLYVKDKQTIVIFLLLIEMVIHGPIAVNNYWAFQMFYTMGITFIGYLAIVNMIDTEYKYYKLIKYWLLIFVFLAVYGYFNANLNILKRFRYGMGVGGFVGDANDFCMALNMILPFALFGIFSEKTKNGKLYYIFLTCLFLLVIIFSESRGGFLGLLSVVIYSWMRSNKKLALAAIIGILVIFAFIVAPTGYWDEVGSISSEASGKNTSGTGAQRIYAWKLGWKMFQENPIMGVGQGNYPWNAGKAEDELGVLWQSRSLSGRAAHSLYFTLLSELGMIGTTIFIAMVLFSFKDLKLIRNVIKANTMKVPEDEKGKIYYLVLAMEGSLIGFLVSSVFISTLYYPSFWILCGFILSFKKIVLNKYKYTKLSSVPIT